VNVFWSEFASLQLLNIHQYYKSVAGYKVSGQLELHLEHLNQGHRYLVSGNYKIIYKTST